MDSATPQQTRNWPRNTAVLLEFGEGNLEENWWTVNHAFQGTQVFGATGSGKSTGSGRALAKVFLESNFGGLILTAKNDERAEWEKLALDYGRKDDLIIFAEDQPHRFDFLEYEQSRRGRGSKNTENLVNVFWTVMEAADRKNRGGGEAFWTRAQRQLLRNAIDLSIIAADAVNLRALYLITTSAPSSIDQYLDQEWRKGSLCAKMLLLAEARCKEIGREKDFEIVKAYWTQEFAQLAVETRTSIVTMFSSMADCFLRGMLREMFCEGSNFSPEDCFKGKIIILDFPVKEYGELGIFAQVLFKYIWQRAVERRVPAKIDRKMAQETIRPVFLWADESQFFVNSYDAMFQSTARSSRACTVYLTQNLPGYVSAFTNEGGRPAAEAFLGNLQTKIFHANGDPATNDWASRSIGASRQVKLSGGVTQDPTKGATQNAGAQMGSEFLVQPQDFTHLAMGGDDHDGIVEGIIFQGGRLWTDENGDNTKPRNFIRHRFKQYETAGKK